MLHCLLPRSTHILRRSFTSSSRSTMASPFTRAVVSSMRTLYPEVLADQSFDNTGLLLEAPFLPSRRNRNSVLLTIDLTKAVAEEAIRNNHSAVIAYHPVIFRALKAITLDDSQQQSLLRLAANGVSVYSPHTAVDIVPGGMADWLCDIVTGKLDPPEPEVYTMPGDGMISPPSETSVTTSESASEAKDQDQSQEQDEEQDRKPSSSTEPTTPDQPNSAATTDPFTSPKTPKPKRPSNFHRTYSKPTYPLPKPTFHMASLPHSRAIITASPKSSLDAANDLTSSSLYNPSNTGSGRLITFKTPQSLTLLITRIAHAIGLPKGFPVAIPQSASVEDISVKTVGVCPGSGGSVLRNASPTPDLVFTGELSHHEALAITERGGSVISLFHSNSERGYLHSVLQPQLEKKLKSEWESLRNELKSSNGGKEGWEDGIEEILEDEGAEVAVSEVDRDPFGIVVLVESQVEGVMIDTPESRRK